MSDPRSNHGLRSKKSIHKNPHIYGDFSYQYALLKWHIRTFYIIEPFSTNISGRPPLVLKRMLKKNYVLRNKNVKNP